MLAPPPGRTFDDSEDELPVKASGEDVVPQLSKYPIPTSAHTSTVPEDEPLLSAQGVQKECDTSVGSKVRKCNHGLTNYQCDALPAKKITMFILMLMQIMGHIKCVIKFLKDKQLLQPPIVASVCIAVAV